MKGCSPPLRRTLLTLNQRLKMNNNSVSYSNIKNQQPSFWIDDPFELGANAVKGLKPMSHNRALSNYAEDLVSQYAKFHSDAYHLYLDDLPELEQNELARLYLEFANRDTSECIYGDDFTINSEFTCALLAMLSNDNKKTREKLAEVTRKNIITYYKEALNDVLSAACDNLMHVEMNDAGFRSQYDMDNGDVIWSKF